jgi:hypothetical protein
MMLSPSTGRSIHEGMPDSRGHRGAHPEDKRDFAPACLARLRSAVDELSFLFERSYAPDAALKLVGDHHQLSARQRKAVLRASCAESARGERLRRRLTGPELAGAELVLDGFNVLITVEAWLSGAPLFRGRDTALRDLASVHGTYRSVEETERAAAWIVETLVRCQVRGTRMLFDRPVGNSGRTRALLEQTARAQGLLAQIELSDDVDRELVSSGLPVASSDAWILDQAAHWLDLPELIGAGQGWLLDLS